MTTNTLNLTGTGSAYIRVSEDDQNEARQRGVITAWCERHRVRIPPERWYIDHGWARDEADDRPDFQRLIKDAQDDSIQWIAVAEDDRFGCKPGRQLDHYLYLLNEAECRLFNAKDEELTADDIASVVTSAVKADASARERRSLATRVHSAMRDKAKRGEWGGGRVPFGFDAVCYGLDMVERWRVVFTGNGVRVKLSPDGTRRDYGTDGFPSREQGEVIHLRPTVSPGTLDAVRNVFQTFDRETINFNQLAVRLNATNFRPNYRDWWDHDHVSYLLANPIYIGYPTWNRNTRAKYLAWRGGMAVERKPGMAYEPNDRADWFAPNAPMFEPVVDINLFERVQVKLAALAKVSHKARAPKSAAMWFRGLVYCGTCGKLMQARKGSKPGAMNYLCSTYVGWPRGKPRKDCPCTPNIIRHDRLVEMVREYLVDTAPAYELLSVATQPQPRPDALKKAIATVQESFAGIVRRLAEDNRVVCMEDPGSVHFGGHDEIGDDLAAAYAKLYAGSEVQDRARLDQMEAGYRQQAISLARAPSEMARQVIAEHMATVEADIKELRHRTTNYVAQYADACREARRMGAEWEAAKVQLEQDRQGRQASAAVRKVIDRITLWFEPSGKKNPASVLRRWEILPTGLTSNQDGQVGQKICQSGSGSRHP